MRVRVGEISFVNFIPLCVEAEYPSGCEILRAYPKLLNDECRHGNLDISPISFFAFNDIKNDYEILSNFTIASDGEVDSVKIYSNFEISELKGKRIFFTEKSESSIAAFCAICKKKYGFNPRDFASKNLVESDAALLIGDDVFSFNSHFEKSWDIGKLWKETFKIPMVYSVIVAKKTLPQNLKDEFAKCYENSLKDFFSCPEKFAKIASQRFAENGKSFTVESAMSYYSKLIYRQNLSIIHKALEILNGNFD